MRQGATSGIAWQATATDYFLKATIGTNRHCATSLLQDKFTCQGCNPKTQPPPPKKVQLRSTNDVERQRIIGKQLQWLQRRVYVVGGLWGVTSPCSRFNEISNNVYAFHLVSGVISEARKGE